MKYFPFFMDVSGKHGLIVGGGQVAYQKLRAMLSYDITMTVIGENICDQIKKTTKEHPEKIEWKEQQFASTDLKQADVVFAATSNEMLNHLIAEECKKMHLLVNVVDQQEECNFIMPAILHTEELQIAISSGGTSPAAVGYLKRFLEMKIPDGFDRLVRQLGDCRGYVKEMVPDQKVRKRVFDWLLILGIQNKCSISDKLIKEVVAQMSQEE
ncbi:MAG: bifunctional precorrin-2 dehydrogenase/sirohydrochlorin ferrochelatase [bacterium]|nr:bifunctional precorrin-2 dehydrogenase/sirohydrochlorin ferrochelatase [bacterium]